MAGYNPLGYLEDSWMTSPQGLLQKPQQPGAPPTGEQLLGGSMGMSTAGMNEDDRLSALIDDLMTPRYQRETHYGADGEMLGFSPSRRQEVDPQSMNSALALMDMVEQRKAAAAQIEQKRTELDLLSDEINARRDAGMADAEARQAAAMFGAQGKIDAAQIAAQGRVSAAEAEARGRPQNRMDPASLQKQDTELSRHKQELVAMLYDLGNSDDPNARLQREALLSEIEVISKRREALARAFDTAAQGGGGGYGGIDPGLVDRYQMPGQR